MKSIVSIYFDIYHLFTLGQQHTYEIRIIDSKITEKGKVGIIKEKMEPSGTWCDSNQFHRVLTIPLIFLTFFHICHSGLF